MADIQLKREGNTFILNLGKDENRLDRAFLDEVGHALDQVEASTDPVVLVTTAEGKFYSNGFNLGWMGSIAAGERRR